MASSYASITRPVYTEEAEPVVNFPCCYTCPVICVKCQCKAVHHAAITYIYILIDNVFLFLLKPQSFFNGLESSCRDSS
jgi:hypothetical protein